MRRNQRQIRAGQHLARVVEEEAAGGGDQLQPLLAGEVFEAEWLWRLLREIVEHTLAAFAEQFIEVVEHRLGVGVVEGVFVGDQGRDGALLNLAPVDQFAILGVELGVDGSVVDVEVVDEGITREFQQVLGRLLQRECLRLAEIFFRDDHGGLLQILPRMVNKLSGSAERQTDLLVVLFLGHVDGDGAIDRVEDAWRGVGHQVGGLGTCDGAGLQHHRHHQL